MKCIIGYNDRKKHSSYLQQHIKPYQKSYNRNCTQYPLSLDYDTTNRIAQKESYGFNEHFLSHKLLKVATRWSFVETEKAFINPNADLPEPYESLLDLAKDYRRICASDKAHVHVFLGEIYFDGCD